MMATEAVKVLTGIGTPAVGKLVVVDALGVGARTLSFAADPDRPPTTADGTESAAGTSGNRSRSMGPRSGQKTDS
jgi:hypothetical protein